MRITKTDFCKFSLVGRMRLIKDYGEFVKNIQFFGTTIQIYKICGFHVEVIINPNKMEFVRIDPIHSEPLFRYYMNIL